MKFQFAAIFACLLAVAAISSAAPTKDNNYAKLNPTYHLGKLYGKGVELLKVNETMTKLESRLENLSMADLQLTHHLADLYGKLQEKLQVNETLDKVEQKIEQIYEHAHEKLAEILDQLKQIIKSDELTTEQKIKQIIEVLKKAVSDVVHPTKQQKLNTGDIDEELQNVSSDEEDLAIDALYQNANREDATEEDLERFDQAIDEEAHRLEESGEFEKAHHLEKLKERLHAVITEAHGHLKKIGEKGQEHWENAAEKVQEHWENASEKVQEHYQAASEKAKEHWQNVSEKTKEQKDKLAEKAQKYWSNIKDMLKKHVKTDAEQEDEQPEVDY